MQVVACKKRRRPSPRFSSRLRGNLPNKRTLQRPPPHPPHNPSRHWGDPRVYDPTDYGHGMIRRSPPTPPPRPTTAWSVKTRPAPTRHRRDARVNDLMTTATHEMSTAPPAPRPPQRNDCARIHASGRFVFLYTFENFSQARNTVLSETWQNFPQASHILIADADWRPTLDTVDLSELDFHHRSFHFLIWDHTGHTTRLAGWLLRNDKRLRFKYR